MTSQDPVRNHIPSLDGLRALAILSVVVVHAYYRGPDSHLSGLAAQLVVLGWSGVDLFFVLSGFLITSILLESKKSPQRYFRDFYIKRLARIFPLYYSILVAFLLLALLPIPLPTRFSAMTDNFLGHWWAYFLFISNLGDLFGWNLNNPMGPAWSLAVEEQYYLLWPAVVFLLSHQQLKIAAPLLLIGFAALRLALVDHLTPVSIYHFTLTHADGLLTGSIVAIYRDQLVRKATFAWISAVLLGATLAFVFAAAGTTHYENSIIQRWGYFPLGLFYGAILVLALTEPRISALLSIKPLRIIVNYSYCIYLIHWPLLLVADQVPMQDGLLPWLVFVLTFIFVLTTLAALSSALLEKPAAAAIRRYGLIDHHPQVSHHATTKTG